MYINFTSLTYVLPCPEHFKQSISRPSSNLVPSPLLFKYLNYKYECLNQPTPLAKPHNTSNMTNCKRLLGITNWPACPACLMVYTTFAFRPALYCACSPTQSFLWCGPHNSTAIIGIGMRVWLGCRCGYGKAALWIPPPNHLPTF